LSLILIFPGGFSDSFVTVGTTFDISTGVDSGVGSGVDSGVDSISLTGGE